MTKPEKANVHEADRIARAVTADQRARPNLTAAEGHLWDRLAVELDEAKRSTLLKMLGVVNARRCFGAEDITEADLAELRGV